jgi:heavy metal sensor kinase
VKALSIGARLTLWYTLILALSLCLFGAIAYFAMRESIRSTVDGDLHQRIQAIRDIIQEDAPSGIAALQDEFRELQDSEGSDARLRVAYQSGQPIFASAGMETALSPLRNQNPSRPFTAHVAGVRFRVFRQTLEVGGAEYDVEVASSMGEYDRVLERFRVVLYACVPAFLLLAALGGYWLSRRALAPVDEITEAARTIGAKDLSRRIAVSPSSDELQRLAETLNGMLARLEASFQRVTQFTADASHELRSPVSVVRTSAELALRKPRSEAEYCQALGRILEESERVSKLIDQLLLLARADSGAAALPAVRIDLTASLQAACEEAQVLADAKQLKFSKAIPDRSFWIEGDTASLHRLFLILLDNAVKYTPTGGEVDVRLRSDDGWAVAAFHDSGIGISEQDIPHIFDRFYRSDRARSRESGGAGLGLAIGRWIAEAHRGEIRVESHPAKGSTFEVRIPLSTQPSTRST